jgi:phage terminase large subunit
MEFDRKTDFHLYEHVWLGGPKRVSNSIILNQRYRVGTDDEEWFADPDAWRQHGQGERLYYGADFGFAQDPGCLLRMFEHVRTGGGPGVRD